MNKKLTIHIPAMGLKKSNLIYWAIFMYFSSSPICVVLGKITLNVFSANEIETVFAWLFSFVILILILQNIGKKSVRIFLGIVLAVTLYFLATLMVHPEYYGYYVREVVGIVDCYYAPVSGCAVALLLTLLCANDESLFLRAVTTSSWVNVAYYLLLAVSRNGTWMNYNSAGQLIEKSYNIGLGYKIVFYALIFLSNYLMNRKKVIFLLSLWQRDWRSWLVPVESYFVF